MYKMIVEFAKAIPDVDDVGEVHKAKCPCGGTIRAMRSVNGGRLFASCDKCWIKVEGAGSPLWASCDGERFLDDD